MLAIPWNCAQPGLVRSLAHPFLSVFSDSSLQKHPEDFTCHTG